MTFRTSSFALAIFLGGWVAACGGSTTLEFVGENPDGSGGLGGSGDGGSGDGGSGDGGTSLGGQGGDPGTGGRAVIVLPYCGDGSIDSGEECDDGNELSRDGCSSSCAVEPPFVCNGEPSLCGTVGNGSLDNGEECEDGNVLSGDGCSSTGSVEGTCAEPAELEFEEDGLVTLTATVTSDTSTGGANVEAQACGGLWLGAGNDRVFEFEVPQDSDLTISVDSEFDAIVRLYGGNGAAACDIKQEGFCIDDVGAGEVERFHAVDVEAGARIFVAVDGAQEDEDGEFTLTVSAGCDIQHLKVHRLSTYKPAGNNSVLSLKNTADYCSLDLSQAGMVLSDDSGLVESPLPQQALGPLQVFRGSFDVNPDINPNSYDLSGTLTYFDAIASGATLCDGPCDMTGGTNVIDMMVVGTYTATLPGVTFGPAPLPNVGAGPHAAHVRVGHSGMFPDFRAEDWSPAFIVDPDDFAVLAGTVYNDTGDDMPPAAVTSDPAQGNVMSVVPTTSGYESVYAYTMPDLVQNPTYISYKIRTGDAAMSGCFTGFGINNGSLGLAAGYSDAGDIIRFYKFYSSASYFGWALYNYYYPVGLDTIEWHVVEFENIDWANHTYDLRYDGLIVATDHSMTDTTSTVLTTFSVTPYYLLDCHFSDVIVRNGPPGRTWESPPVLP